MSWTYIDATAAVAAAAMSRATACGWDTQTAWLPATSITEAPARSDMNRWAAGGIMRSSVATRYQLGFDRQAGVLTAP